MSNSNQISLDKRGFLEKKGSFYKDLFNEIRWLLWLKRLSINSVRPVSVRGLSAKNLSADCPPKFCPWLVRQNSVRGLSAKILSVDCPPILKKNLQRFWAFRCFGMLELYIYIGSMMLYELRIFVKEKIKTKDSK